MDREYDVYCNFDLDKHKQKYVNYLEVMIEEDGTVHYAVPSHQEWAIYAACRKLGVSREELCDMTPADFYFDWLTWLLMQSGSMAVWNNHYECQRPTRAQYNTLRRLKLGGVYHGDLPRMPKSVSECQTVQK